VNEELGEEECTALTYYIDDDQVCDTLKEKNLEEALINLGIVKAVQHNNND
jgi:hypothetical protein